MTLLTSNTCNDNSLFLANLNLLQIDTTNCGAVIAYEPLTSATYYEVLIN